MKSETVLTLSKLQFKLYHHSRDAARRPNWYVKIYRLHESHDSNSIFCGLKPFQIVMSIDLFTVQFLSLLIGTLWFLKKETGRIDFFIPWIWDLFALISTNLCITSSSKQTAVSSPVDQQPSSPPSQVQCSLCGWNFDNDSFLQLHMVLMHSKR